MCLDVTSSCGQNTSHGGRRPTHICLSAAPPSAGTAALILEPQTQHVLVELPHVVGLGPGGDGLQQTLRRGKSSASTVCGKTHVVSP